MFLIIAVIIVTQLWLNVAHARTSLTTFVLVCKVFEMVSQNLELNVLIHHMKLLAESTLLI